MGRRLDPAVCADDRTPLGEAELLQVRALVADSIIGAATARDVDLGQIRELAHVAQMVDRRLGALAAAGAPPTLARRQAIKAESDPMFRRS